MTFSPSQSVNPFIRNELTEQMPCPPSASVLSEEGEKFATKIEEKAITSVQKQQIDLLLKGFGCEDALTAKILEKTSFDKNIALDHLFEAILNTFSSEDLEKLDYDQLLSHHNSRGVNLLFEAIYYDKHDLFCFIIQKASPAKLVLLKDNEGRTMLHLAAMYGREQILEVILNGNASLANCKEEDKEGLTPLHLAIHEGHEKIVEKLLQYDLMWQDWKYQSMQVSNLALTVVSGYPSILSLLLKNNFFKELHFNSPISQIGTILHLAIHANQSKMLEHLLDHQHQLTASLLSQTDSLGRTPLQLAAFLGDLFAIRRLILKEVQIHQGEHRPGGTALHWAVKGKQPEAINLLLSLAADPTRNDADGKAPLAYITKTQLDDPVMKRCHSILSNFIASKRLEKIKEVNFNERAPFNLILEGSYDRLDAYLSVIDELEKKGILHSIRRYSGQGLGALVAAFLAIGCAGSQIAKPSFLGLGDLFQLSPDVTEKEFKDIENGCHISANHNHAAFLGLAPLCDAQQLRDSLEEWIAEKTQTENFTLGDLSEKAKKFPLVFKHLHLSVYSFEKKETVVFNTEDSAYAEFILSDILVSLLTFPGIFKTTVLQRRNNDKGVYQDTTYGKTAAPILTPSLIGLFDAYSFQEDSYLKGVATNYRTLALHFKHTSSQAYSTPFDHSLQQLIQAYIAPLCHTTISENLSRGRVHYIVSQENSDESYDQIAKQHIAKLFSVSQTIDRKLPSVKHHHVSYTGISTWKYDIFRKSQEVSKEVAMLKEMQPICTLPKIPSNFTGREQELKALEEAFKQSDKVAISGLGGLGKSTLSLKYAHSLSGYVFIHFIKSITPHSIKTGLVELAGLLQIKKDDFEETLGELKLYLQTMTRPGLILMDGLDEESALKELDHYLPEKNRCQVLITTRIGKKAEVNGFTHLPLASFSEQEAITYLTLGQTVSDEECGVAKDLAKEVGYLPLALSHIIRYLTEEKLTFTAYQKRFQKSKLKLPGKDALNLPSHEASVFMTWEVSLTAIQKKENGALAISIMQLIACLAEDLIPYDLLATWADGFYPYAGEYEITAALKLLKDYAFLEEKDSELDRKRYYSCHSLVQKVIAHTLALHKTEQPMIQAAVQSVNQILQRIRSPHYTSHWEADLKLYKLYSAHLSTLYHQPLIKHSVHQEQYRKLLSHLGWISKKNYHDQLALSYIEEGLQGIEAEPTASQSLITAELYDLKSWVQTLGYPVPIQDRIQLATEALTIREKFYQENPEDLIQSYERLAQLYEQLGDLPESLKFRRKILQIRKEILDEKSPYIFKSYEEVIRSLQKLGMQKEALGVAKELLETRKTALGEGSYDTSRSYKMVIESLMDLEQKEEALEVAIQRLESRKEALGEHHEYTAKSYEALISTLWKLDLKEQALKEANTRLVARRKTLQEDHEYVLQSYSQVIWILSKLDQKEEALKVAKQMLQTRKEVLGQGHEYTLRAYEEVIQLLRKLQKDQEALEVAQEHMKATQALSDKEHEYNSSKSYEQVIWTLRGLGRKEEALHVAEKMLKTRRELLGEDHYETTKSYIQVIESLQLLEKKEAALEVAKSMLETRKQTLGSLHSETLKSYETVIEALKELGRGKEVLKTFKELDSKKKIRTEADKGIASNSHEPQAERLRKVNEADLKIARAHFETNLRKLGEGYHETSTSYEKMMEILRKLGRKEELLTQGKKRLQARKKSLGEGHQYTSRSYEEVVKILKELDKKEEVLEIAQDRLRSRINTLGKGHDYTLRSYEMAIIIFREFKKEEEALEMAQELLSVCKEALGQKHSHTSKAYQEVIDLLKKLGRKDEALQVANEMLTIRKAILGEEDTDTLAASQIVDSMCKQAQDTVEVVGYIQQVPKPELEEEQKDVKVGLLNEVSQLKKEAVEVAKINLSYAKESLGEENYITQRWYRKVIQGLKELERMEEVLEVTKEILKGKKEAVGEKGYETSNVYQDVISLLLELGRQEEAIEMAKERLQAKKDALGEADWETSRSYDGLISLLQNLHKEEEALEIAKKMVEVRKEALGEGGWETFTSYEKLIELLMQRGREDEAVKAAKENLKGMQEALGKGDGWTLQSHKNLIDLLMQLNRQEEAVEVAKEMLKARQEILGKEPELTSTNYQKIIKLLKQLDREEEVLQAAKELLKKRQEVLGQAHERTSEGYHQVIELLKQLNREEEAVEVAKEMLKTKQDALGEEDKWVSKSYHQVIELLIKLGRQEEAIEVAKGMLNKRKEALGEEDEWVSESYQQIIELLKKLNREEEALEVAKEMLKTRKEALGEEDEWVSESYRQIIELLKKLNREEEALEVAKEMLKTRKEALGEEDEWVSESYRQIIELLKKLNREEEALEMAKEMLKTRKEALGEEDEWTSQSYREVIELLIKLGKQEEALESVKKVLKTRQETLGARSEWTVEAYTQMIGFLTMLGRQSEALEAAKEMLKLRKETLKKRSKLIADSYKEVTEFLIKLGRQSEALEVAKEMLRARGASDDMWDSLEDSKNYKELIALFKKLDSQKEAVEVAKEMLKVRQEALGEANTLTSESYQELIELLIEFDRQEEAVSVATGMLKIRQEVLGKEHERMSESDSKIIKLLKKINREEEALEFAKEMLQARRAALGVANKRTSEAYQEVLGLLKKLNKEEEALEFAKEMLKVRQAALGVENEQTSEAYQEVIQWLIKRDRQAEALEFAKEMFKSIQGPLGEGEGNWRNLNNYERIIIVLNQLEK